MIRFSIILLFITTISFTTRSETPLHNILTAQEIEKATEDLAIIGDAPQNKEDCNCENDEKTPNKTKVTKDSESPWITFSFGIESDGNSSRNIRQYDCSKSTVASEITNIVSQVGNFSHEEYKNYVASKTKHFTGQDITCLANRFGRLGNAKYKMKDGIGLYSLKEMHECMQASKAKSPASCRTCAPIHHYTADLIESIGGKCGLIVNQTHTYGSDPVTGDTDRSYTRRGMHYINVCKMGQRYFLLNYGKNYQVEALSYQEAVDIANIGFGEGNWAGNQITCMNKGENTLSDCSHIYLSRSTRYQLSKIQTAIDQVGNNNSPIHLALSNLKQEVRFVIDTTSKTKKTLKNNSVKETNITHAFISGYERYRGEDFAQTGWVRRSHVKVTAPGETRPNRESTQDLYVGIAGINGDQAIQLKGGMQSVASILIYLKRMDRFQLNNENDLTIDFNLVAGSDHTNGFTHRSNGAGQTNVLSLTWGNQINDTTRAEIGQALSLMTDRANIPVPQLGATTIKFKFELLKNLTGAKLNNTTTLHFLHGGLSDETFALQNSTQLQLVSLGPSNIDLSLSSDLGYTTESINGRDVFYDHGFWAEANMSILQPLYKSGTQSLYILLEGGLTTGSRPAQFAIDPLTIEKNPTRESINSSYNGFIKLGGSF
jgi:hypothetical protein